MRDEDRFGRSPECPAFGAYPALKLAAMAAVCLMGLVCAQASAAGCEMQKLNVLEVRDWGAGPVAAGTLDGRNIAVLLDTGAFRSMVIQRAAQKAGLAPRRMGSLHLRVVGGRTAAAAVNVKSLKIGNFQTTNRRMLVAPFDFPGVDLILGADVLSHFDVEFDLAAHKVVLWKTRHCDHAALAYWSHDYLTAPLHRWGAGTKNHGFGLDVQVDGQKLLATLDSGASRSMMDMQTARRLGFDAAKAKPVTELRLLTGRKVPAYLATFDSFTMGRLTVHNARFQVSDTRNAGDSRSPKWRGDVAHVIIGADFLRADRVYIANSQRRLYFTYGGGLLFQRAR